MPSPPLSPTGRHRPADAPQRPAADPAPVAQRASVEPPRQRAASSPLQARNSSPSSPRLPSPSASDAASAAQSGDFDPLRTVSTLGGTGGLAPRQALSRTASRGSSGSFDPLATISFGSPSGSVRGDASQRSASSGSVHASASQRSASSGVAAAGPSMLQRAVRALDIHGLVTHADDKEFLRDVAPHVQRLRASLSEMKDSLGRLEGLPPRLHAPLRQRLDKAIAAADSLLTDQPLPSRMAKGAVMFAALSPLPLALPFLTKPKQLQYAALTIAHYSKTLIGMGGLVSRPKTDNAQWMRHFNERHLTAFLPAALSVGPLLAKPDLVSSPAFYVPTGIALTAAAFASAYPDKVKSLFRSVANARRGDQGEDGITDEVRDEIRQMLGGVRPAEQEISTTRNELGPRGLSLSDSTQAQASAVTGSVNDLFKAVGALTHHLEAIAIDQGDGDGPAVARRGDPDRSAKVAMAVFSGIATFGSAAIVYPDIVGVTDFASDAAFVTTLMASIAMDPAKTKQDSLAMFKSMVGLSLLSIGFLGANKISPFLGEDMAKMVAGTAAIVGANLTLPGPVGQAAGMLIEAGADVGSKVYQQMKRGLGFGGDAGHPDADADALSDLSSVGPAAAIVSPQAADGPALPAAQPMAHNPAYAPGERGP
jgi:hypothetical protein